MLLKCIIPPKHSCIFVCSLDGQFSNSINCLLDVKDQKQTSCLSFFFCERTDYNTVARQLKQEELSIFQYIGKFPCLLHKPRQRRKDLRDTVYTCQIFYFFHNKWCVFIIVVSLSASQWECRLITGLDAFKCAVRKFSIRRCLFNQGFFSTIVRVFFLHEFKMSAKTTRMSWLCDKLIVNLKVWITLTYKWRYFHDVWLKTIKPSVQ